ncbi:MAG: hypothetical protein ABJG15_09125 [Hyphomonadaceae bacterium]
MTKVMITALLITVITFGLLLFAGAPAGYAVGYVAAPFLVIAIISGIIRLFKKDRTFGQIYMDRDIALLVLNAMVLLTLFVQT